MSFNEGSQLDPTRVNDARGAGGGGGRPGLAIGGGVGGIIVLVLSIIFGPQALSGVVNGDPAQSTSEIQNTAGAEINSCTTGASANEREDCRILGTVQSLDSYWKDQGADSVRVQFQAPGVKIFSSGTNTACGSATSAVGPFYCPGDSTIYIDPSFFAELTQNYGADDGALAQEYVVAHEYGHHMQNLTGAIENSQRGSGSQGGSVRVELQADCYAGVWANHASSTTDASGNRLIKQLTEQDVDSALSAAAAVGDDHIQQKTTGRVSPESWSHGSSEQRKAWFMAGYESGDPGMCDTFQTDNLNSP